MAVFEPSSGNVVIMDLTSAPQNVNLNGNISTIVNRVTSLVFGLNSYFVARDSGGNRTFGNDVSSDGLPVFGAGAAVFTLTTGHYFAIVESQSNTNVDVVEGYVNGENPPDLTLFVSVGMATVAAGGQFFIDETGITTTTPATTNIGYAEPTCDSGMRLRTDRLGCEPVPATPNPPVCEPASAMLNTAGDACECRDGFQNLDTSADPQRCEMSDGGGGGGESPTPATGGGGVVVAERDDGAEEAAYIGGGMLAVGIASYFFWDGNLLAFSFSPDYGYSITESGYAYNFGGRLDFQQGDFRSYYAVGRANSNGEFGDLRYESGGKYAADFWTAAFSETVQGETADYRFSLSADYKGGIWQVSPTYRLHSHFADEEFETANSLNLEGILRYNRWTISPSAGFNWRRPEEFGDNARFNLSAVRRF